MTLIKTILNRNSLKTAISFEHETANTLINQIASNPDQAQSSVNDLFKAIDAVSANDVNAVRKQKYFFVFFRFPTHSRY